MRVNESLGPCFDLLFIIVVVRVRFAPHTCLPKICTARPPITLFALFFVCYVPMHSPAPIQTHPHPPESFLALLSLFTHTCLFGGTFPGHACIKSIPYTPILSCFVLFVCVSVPLHHTTPIQAHLHPSVPVHTRSIH